MKEKIYTRWKSVIAQIHTSPSATGRQQAGNNYEFGHFCLEGKVDWKEVSPQSAQFWQEVTERVTLKSLEVVNAAYFLPQGPYQCIGEDVRTIPAPGE